jgi:hypothetical protein
MLEASLAFLTACMALSGCIAAQARIIHPVQSNMPVIPPPGQRVQPSPSQGPAPRAVTIDDLARMGYDVKAIDRAGQSEGRFVVMMQRAGDVKTCLMRIDAQRGQPPQRQSACF